MAGSPDGLQRMRRRVFGDGGRVGGEPSVNPLQRITTAGQSIWVDDLSRPLLSGGELRRLVDEDGVSGVTTNPTILAKALSGSNEYDEGVRTSLERGATVDELYRRLVTTDIRGACDVLAPVWTRTRGADGFVSVEVTPAVAHDAGATVREVRDWVRRVDRGNLLVKVPATAEGAEAFETSTAEGVSVNVTLIFSLDRYRDIATRYVSGIERFVEAGGDPSRVHSVASFFVSRVDTEVDARIDGLPSGSPVAALRGKAGIANARAAYAIFREVFSGERWARLAATGATLQRPLWASTGTKDPAYPDTMYVDRLVSPNTVNTMPRDTLAAVADHGDPGRGFSEEDLEEAAAVLDALSRGGVDYADVTAVLEREGLENFSASFDEAIALLERHRAELGA